MRDAVQVTSSTLDPSGTLNIGRGNASLNRINTFLNTTPDERERERERKKKSKKEKKRK